MQSEHEPANEVSFDKLLDGKETLLEDCRIMQDYLTNCAVIDAELDELLREIAVVTELTQRCIQENAQSALCIQLSLNLHPILEGEHQPPIVVGCGFLHHRQPEERYFSSMVSTGCRRIFFAHL